MRPDEDTARRGKTPVIEAITADFSLSGEQLLAARVMDWIQHLCGPGSSRWRISADDRLTSPDRLVQAADKRSGLCALVISLGGRSTARIRWSSRPSPVSLCPCGVLCDPSRSHFRELLGLRKLRAAALTKAEVYDCPNFRGRKNCVGNRNKNSGTAVDQRESFIRASRDLRWLYKSQPDLGVCYTGEADESE
ncbi:hypothetical protein RRG08_015529 [Elysia crispata]|uniref:Uncharacterized protein n=1 Tax=Elysia crispata TaxID=231223 RepID=A0AAE1CZM1_9GAST|nr:hypothetical protein RRG08_015529 [Elysia crispata]